MLIGLGMTELSMSAGSLPLVKKVLRSISFREAQGLAKQALKMDTSTEIRALLAESPAGRRVSET
jgi:phosphotransferase system enzyme I (PtsI)